MRSFGTGANRALHNTIGLSRKLNTELNGFSELSKLAATLGGLSLARDAMADNLNFERDVLEMKQNAGMTIQQANEIRRMSVEKSAEAMQTPQAMMEGAKALARAGEKYETIAAKMFEAGRAATVFRATVEEIANMDVDLSDKLKIDPARMKDVHNMLYYHGNAGRFEAPKLAQFAPELFNAVSAVGIGGERGLNFTGALTQVLMKYASVNEPGKVKTLMEQGLQHVTDSSYVKNIKKATGIDVRKYAPGGKFYGEGGVDGLLDFTDALKKKGLTDPFKMSQAGIKDAETIKFFRALMQYSDEIRQEMTKADTASKQDQISIDLAEMKQANFGKIKAAEIEVAKLKLSDNATKATGGVAGMAKWAGDHPLEAVGGAAALLLGGRWAMKKGLPKLLAKVEAHDATRLEKAAQPRPSLKTNTAGQITNHAEIKAWDKAAAGEARGAKFGKAGRVAGKVGGVLVTTALAASEAVDIANDPALNASQKKVAWTGLGGDVAGGAAGGWGGAALGAAIGTAILPGIGTAIGGLLGGLGGAMAGGWLGNKAGTAVGEAAFGEAETANRMAAAVDKLAPAADKLANPQPIPVKVTVDVLNGNIVAAVNAANAQSGRRF